MGMQTVAWGAAGTAEALAGSAEEAGLVKPDARRQAECTDCREVKKRFVTALKLQRYIFYNL